MSNSAKLSARERIESLVDANSFVEIGGMITKRNTDFNMQEKAVPADGVITGYGVVNSNLVYIYSQDVTALNGSVGEMHAKKIAGIYEMAMKAGAPDTGTGGDGRIGRIWRHLHGESECIRCNPSD